MITAKRIAKDKIVITNEFDETEVLSDKNVIEFVGALWPICAEITNERANAKTKWCHETHPNGGCEEGCPACNEKKRHNEK